MNHKLKVDNNQKMEGTKVEFKVDGFFNWLYETYVSKKNIIESCSAEQFDVIKNQKRTELKKLLGINRLEEIEHPVSVEKLGVYETQGNFQTQINTVLENTDYIIESMSMEILPFLKMPFYIIKPKTNIRKSSDGSEKAVLYCHGHGASGCRDCFDIKEPRAYHKNIPITLAKRGYTVFVFEPIGFGDFNMDSFKQPQHSGCHAISTQLLMYGISALGLRIFQAMKLTDYMMEEYKISDFATVGISGGGTVCSLYAAIDDRTKGSVISCYTNMFKDSIMAMNHCVDNFIYDVLSIGEMPHIISLAFPKPMFLSCGKNDPIYPEHGAKKAVHIIKKLYNKFNMADKIEAEFFEGGHEFSEKFIDWLDINI